MRRFGVRRARYCGPSLRLSTLSGTLSVPEPRGIGSESTRTSIGEVWAGLRFANGVASGRVPGVVCKKTRAAHSRRRRSKIKYTEARKVSGGPRLVPRNGQALQEGRGSRPRARVQKGKFFCLVRSDLTDCGKRSNAPIPSTTRSGSRAQAQSGDGQTVWRRGASGSARPLSGVRSHTRRVLSDGCAPP